eukprot:14112201-Heterocapsa_arctica.AAC.1
MNHNVMIKNKPNIGNCSIHSSSVDIGMQDNPIAALSVYRCRSTGETMNALYIYLPDELEIGF